MNLTETTIQFGWKKVENANFYRIRRDGEVVVETKELSFLDKNLIPSTNYVYFVEAVIWDGEVVATSDNFKVSTKDKSYV